MHFATQLGSTLKPQYNEPRYNEPRYSEQNPALILRIY